MSEPTKTPLFFQSRFWPMWVALSFGTFADNVLRQALMIAVTFGALSVPGFSNADNALPWIGMLLPLGILSFSFLAGQLAEKFETATMFRRTKVTELALMALAATGFAFGSGPIAILALFLMGVQSAFFAPVRVAAMPKYLSTEELVRGNGLCNAGLFTFILLGYGVGGGLIAIKNGGFYVGLVLVFAALIGWLAALRAEPRPATHADLKIDWNPVSQLGNMYKYVTQAPGVLPPLLGVGVFFFLTTAVTVVLPLFTRDTLGGGPGVATALNGLFAVGAAIGAIAAASLAKGRSGLGYSTLGIAVAGVLTIMVCFITPLLVDKSSNPLTIGSLFSTPGGWIIALTFVASAAFMGLYIAPLQAAIQRRAPDKVRAQIMASSIFTSALFAVPGSLSIRFITGSNIDPRFAFLAIGVMMLAIAALMMVRREKIPDGTYDEMLLHNSLPPGSQNEAVGPA
ncbi:MAG: MFS transporter [Pseudomonadota bacterium]